MKLPMSELAIAIFYNDRYMLTRYKHVLLKA